MFFAGLNIFTHQFRRRMRFVVVISFILSWFNATGLKAQLSIRANPTSGCDTLTVQFSLHSESTVDTVHSVEWNFGNNTTASETRNPVIKYNSPGIYTVSCLINGNTLITEDGIIEVYQGPVAIFTVSDTANLNPNSKFFQTVTQPVPVNTYFFHWEFSDGPTYFTPSFIRSFDETGAYTVKLTITDQNNCSGITHQEIVVGDIIEVPNVFSPNNDNINDFLIIRTNGINVFSLEIYTRSGTMVYKNVSPNLVWDGRSMSGQEMSPGIYYYIVKQVDGEASQEKNGFVHLIK